MAATSSAGRTATTQDLLAWLLRNGRRAWLCRELQALTGAPPALVEDALQEACLLAATPGRCRGTSEGEVFIWLRATALSKVRDLRRSAYQRHEMPVGLACSGREVAVAAAVEREVIDRERERELLELASVAIAGMTSREREVVALHSQRIRGREIARRLGTSERRVKRLKERAYNRARTTLVEAAGGGCGAGEQLVSSLSFDGGPDVQRGEAIAHLRKCPACLALYKRLEAMHDKIAALLPLPAAAQTDPSLFGRALEKASATAAQVKQQLADLAGHAKQQAATSYTRAVEYTPLASVRPGAAAGVVAGCLALGGGAAGYCVDQGVNPITGLVDVLPKPAEQPARVAQKPLEAKPASEQSPDPPQVPAAPSPTAEPTPTATPPVEPAPTPTPEPAPALEPAPPPVTPSDPAIEFGEPTNAGPVAPAASTSAQSAPAEPLPAPASGPGDLYGP
jgi:RNA polymerase sigma factor (sigma-70 family)